MEVMNEILQLGTKALWTMFVVVAIACGAISWTHIKTAKKAKGRSMTNTRRNQRR